MVTLTFRWIFLLLCTAELAHAQQLNVVATIRPLHSIVSSVMAGTGQPQLLLNQADSPHHHTLKPSKAKLLQNADLFFWYGPALSAHMQHSVESLLSHGVAVNVLDAPGVNPQSYTGQTTNDVALLDPHIWLDPTRMGRVAMFVAAELAAIDPGNASTYEENAAKLFEELAELDEKLATKLAAAANQPMLIMHDAYQYFADHFGLKELHPLLLDAESLPSAKQIKKVNALIDAHDIRCILVEPQFSQKIVSALNRNLAIQSIDPIGFQFQQGAEHYRKMLVALANGVALCADY